MIGVLLIGLLVAYATIYSGVQQLRGQSISIIGSLLGERPVPITTKQGSTKISSGTPGHTVSSGAEGCDDDVPLVRHRNFQLQPQAMAAFRKAEHAVHHPILVTSGWRSCDAQARLYAQKPGVAAPPSGSLHPQGLAVDVMMPVSSRVRAALLEVGFHQFSPSGEPWHFSYGVTG